MKRLLLLGICVLINSITFAKEHENVLEINDEKIYFSLNGHINHKYFNIDSDIYGYKIKKYYKDNISINRNEHNRTNKVIDLPDSLNNDYIKVKKGYKTVKIKSSLMTHSTIQGFKLTPDMFDSTPRVIMSLSDSIKCDWNDLFLITQKSSTLKLITLNPLISTQESDNYDNLTNTIVNFFIKNRNTYKHQMDYRDNHPDSLNNIELEEEIISKFNFQFFKLDDVTYLVNGKTFSEWDNPFIALIMTENNEVIIKSTARLINSFNILDTRYFFCVDFKSGSGAQAYQVFRIMDNRFELVFIDGSYSN